MITRMLSIGAAILIATTLYAQRPDNQRPDNQRPDNQRPGNRQDPRGGPPPGFGGGPPGFHLMETLDADRDGKISSQEIDNAVASLQKLDLDKDGKLSGEEIGWPPSFGGGFPGGPPGFGGGPGRPNRGGPPGFGGGFGGQPGPARRPDPEPTQPLRDDSTRRPASTDRPNREQFFSVDLLMSADRNNDGKITTEEIPKLLRKSILRRVDTNKDGVIEKSELDALGKQQAEQE